MHAKTFDIQGGHKVYLQFKKYITNAIDILIKYFFMQCAVTTVLNSLAFIYVFWVQCGKGCRDFITLSSLPPKKGV